MDSHIKILPQELVDQIAAGEVVERPASVIKELVENSLDAGAKNITIEIENGGLNLIKIIDDGAGMSREDARLSLASHATSKLQSLEDLYNIRTLGFRGEALASISAVSEFSLRTKDASSLSGTLVERRGPNVEIREIGWAAGTTVQAQNLFYNVPARRKYLKTAATEFNHAVDLFFNYCLAYPEISWKFFHNQKLVYQFPATNDLSRAGDVLGDETSPHLLALDIKLNDILLRGFVGKPQIARHNRKLQYLFINQRPVNDFLIAKQVKDAFGTLLSKEMYPVYILDLAIENEMVDVNVHPRKLEVRFSEPAIVYRSVYQAVARLLDEQDLIKTVSAFPSSEFVPVKEVLEEKVGRGRTVSAPDYPLETRPSQAAVNFLRPDTIQYRAEPSNIETPLLVPLSNKKLIQIRCAYILAETDKSLKLYDQHACSERVQYERLKQQWQIGQLASQRMLLPQTIQLTPTEARLVNDHQELLTRLGFELADFGGQSFVVEAVPAVLGKEDPKALILEIIGGLEESIIVEDTISQPLDDVLKMFACKSAIKFGDALSEEGMQALLRDLESLENHYTCVHGRPCVVEFKFEDLDKMFKRKSSAT